MIEKLNLHYAFTNPASIHDEEALTALELAGRQGAKINEVVDSQNKLLKDTTKHLNDQDAAIPNLVEQSVQKHIDNGAFADEINDYVGGLEARVDSLLSSNLPDGSTTLDAEVVDIRTTGAGITHTNAGNSVRAQISDIRNHYGLALESLTEPIYLYSKNQTINTSGVIHGLSGSNVYKAFVVGGAKYWFSQINGGRNATWFYQEDGTPISSFTSIGQYNSLVTVPANTSYVLFASDDTYKKAIVREEYVNKYGSEKYFKLSENVEYAKLEDYSFCNLLDPTKITDNTFLGKSGEDTSSTTYFASDFIPVKKDEVYSLFGRNMTVYPCRFINVYNTSKTHLSQIDESNGMTQQFIVEQDGFVRLSVRKSYADVTDLMYANSEAVSFLEYGDGMVIKSKYLPIGDGKSVNSSLGGQALQKTTESLNANTQFYIADFPQNVKKGKTLSAFAKFSTFTNVQVGWGYESYRGDWFEITPTSVIYKHYESATETKESVLHNLTMSSFIHVNIATHDDGTCTIHIMTLNASFTHTFEWVNEQNGRAFIYSATALTNVKLVESCKDLKHPLWIFGDSYCGITNERIIGQLMNMGYKNFFINALAGQNSTGAYKELIRSLNLGAPKTLVWLLGMNDDTTSYTVALNNVVTICKNMNITLVLAKVPSIPNKDKTDTNAIVVNSGYRYVDLANAVTTNGSTWYNDYLSGDNVHPNEKGAKALAMQLLLDVPEIMSYGQEG